MAVARETKNSSVRFSPAVGVVSVIPNRGIRLRAECPGHGGAGILPDAFLQNGIISPPLKQGRGQVFCNWSVWSRHFPFIFSNCSGARGVPDRRTGLLFSSFSGGSMYPVVTPLNGPPILQLCGGTIPVLRSGDPFWQAAADKETAITAACATRIEPQIGPCFLCRAITSSIEQFVRSKTSFRHLSQNRPLADTFISFQFIGHLNEKWFSVSLFMTRHG